MGNEQTGSRIFRFARFRDDSQMSLKSPWRPLPEAKRVAPAMPSALTMPALVAHSLSRPSRTGLPHAR